MAQKLQLAILPSTLEQTEVLQRHVLDTLHLVQQGVFKEQQVAELPPDLRPSQILERLVLKMQGREYLAVKVQSLEYQVLKIQRPECLVPDRPHHLKHQVLDRVQAFPLSTRSLKVSAHIPVNNLQLRLFHALV